MTPRSFPQKEEEGQFHFLMNKISPQVKKIIFQSPKLFWTYWLPISAIYFAISEFDYFCHAPEETEKHTAELTRQLRGKLEKRFGELKSCGVNYLHNSHLLTRRETGP